MTISCIVRNESVYDAKVDETLALCPYRMALRYARVDSGTELCCEARRDLKCYVLLALKISS